MGIRDMRWGWRWQEMSFQPWRPRPLALLLTVFASACLAFARRALDTLNVSNNRSITIRSTYSSSASRSNICTCCLASRTAALAVPRARSASRSDASASETFCLAARMVGSFLKSDLEREDEDERRREKKPPLRLLLVLLSS